MSSPDEARAALVAARDRAQDRLDRRDSTRWDIWHLDRAEAALAAHDAAQAELAAQARRDACTGFDPGNVLAAWGGRWCTYCGVREGEHR